MKKATNIAVLLTLFTVFSISTFGQGTAKTSTRCYFYNENIPPDELANTSVYKAKIGTIPKGTDVEVIDIENITGLFIKVKHKNKTGWLHRDVIEDKYIVSYSLSLQNVKISGETAENSTIVSSTYEDSVIQITFNQNIDRLSFTLKNKLDKSISLNWNESSWIGSDNIAKRFMHDNMSYSDKNSSVPDRSIPAKSTINDCAIPNDNVSLDARAGVLTDKLLSYVPKCDKDLSIAESYKGDIRLILSFMVNGEKKEYDFTFSMSEPQVTNCY